MIFIPLVLEVVNPGRGKLTLAKQVISPLELSVDGLTGTDAAGRFARYEHSRDLHLHDSHLANSLIETLNNSHGCFKFFLSGFGLGNFQKLLLIDTTIKYSE